MKKFLLTSIATISFLLVFAQVPTNGLVAYYPFNGNANDATGNGNNGTVNGATLTSDRFGNSNSAYDFNGVDNHISINDTLCNFGTGEFTLSSWLYKYDTLVAGTVIGKKKFYC